jgi:hypothetical protein
MRTANERPMMSADTVAKQGRPTALFIGHPGHELRVFGWTSLVHPKVYVLTDGSGSTGTPRLERSAKLLSDVGAGSGTLFGRFSDHEIYQAMMALEFTRFTAMVDELAEVWIRNGIEVVASDASEGYSATHDLCCEMAQAATELIRIQTGRRIERVTFCLTEWEGHHVAERPTNSLRIRLSDEVLDQKIAAAKSYVELSAEVDRALTLKGKDYFREEYLTPASGWSIKEATYKPSYEVYGELRVAEGKFASVLRYGEHVLPILRALREHVTLSDASGASSSGNI